jgi:hypothetical protein
MINATKKSVNLQRFDKIKRNIYKDYRGCIEKMSEDEKDQLIDAQKQVIGILFEVIKRLQTNNDLDEEYFKIMTDETKNEKRIQEILNEREENSKIVGRLLEQLET